LNTKDYTYLLNKPYSLNERQTTELEQILIEFPFLQSARAIYLKGLYNQDSFRYNTELKKTAAYTTDRSVLFDFITSEKFLSVERKAFEEGRNAISDIEVSHSEVSPHAADKTEESVRLSLKAAGQLGKAVEEPVAPPVEAVEQKLDIGKPLEFEKTETHSFAEWLQLSKLTPINRDETQKPVEQEQSFSKKMDLIDKFIESNPKITPSRESPPAPANIEKAPADNTSLMTETLARIYLEQKKYSKAIQAYEILILKYPEKSVFFADRISDIKILQQNNN